MTRLRQFTAILASLALMASLFAPVVSTPAAASGMSMAMTSDAPMRASADLNSPDGCDGCCEHGTCTPAASCPAQCGAGYALPAFESVPPVCGAHVLVIAALAMLRGRGEPPDPHPPK